MLRQFEEHSVCARCLLQLLQPTLDPITVPGETQSTRMLCSPLIACMLHMLRTILLIEGLER